MAFNMPEKFSKELESRLIEYFKGKYDIEITPEQAQEYLDSLANLVLTLEPKQD